MNKRFLVILVLSIFIVISFNFNVYALYDKAKDKVGQKIQSLIEKLSSSSRNELIETRNKLFDIGKPAIPLLIESLNCDNLDKIYIITDILISHKATEAVPSLILLLECEQEEIVLRTICVLGSIGDKRAISPLLKIINETNNDTLKGAAIRSLGMLGDKEVIPILKRELNNNNSYIQIDAAIALGSLDNKEGLPIALKYCDSKKSFEKQSAIIALGIIGDKETIPILEKMLVNSDEKFRKDIILSLKQIKFKNLTKEEKIQFLEECLKSEEIRVKQWAVWELGEIGSPQAIDVLQKSANDEGIKEMIILKLKKLETNIQKDDN